MNILARHVCECELNARAELKRLERALPFAREMARDVTGNANAFEGLKE